MTWMAKTSDLAALVAASVQGDEEAWNEVVRRYTQLVMSVIWQFHIYGPDAQDISQMVWLRLVEHLGDIRDPTRIVAWIITTAKHECLRQLRSAGRIILVDPLNARMLEGGATAAIDDGLLEAERHQALRDGLAELAPQDRELLTLLATDPAPSYAEISRRLGIPIGSIGPTRGRVLEKLRATAAIRAFLQPPDDTDTNGGGQHAFAELE
jgi:RNA polymerase sigma factor (sigma-70 family)